MVQPASKLLNLLNNPESVKLNLFVWVALIWYWAVLLPRSASKKFALGSYSDLLQLTNMFWCNSYFLYCSCLFPRLGETHQHPALRSKQHKYKIICMIILLLITKSHLRRWWWMPLELLQYTFSRYSNTYKIKGQQTTQIHKFEYS